MPVNYNFQFKTKTTTTVQGTSPVVGDQIYVWSSNNTSSSSGNDVEIPLFLGFIETISNTIKNLDKNIFPDLKTSSAQTSAFIQILVTANGSDGSVYTTPFSLSLPQIDLAPVLFENTTSNTAPSTAAYGASVGSLGLVVEIFKINILPYLIGEIKGNSVGNNLQGGTCYTCW